MLALLERETMYTTTCVNEYGQVYSNKGLLERYDGDTGSSTREFPDLDSAKEYGRSFIDTYPQAVCEIFHEKEIIESIRDEDYWAWKNNNVEEWKSTRSKMGHLQLIITGFLLCVLGVLIAVASHYTASISLLYKMLLFPIVLITGTYVFNKVFVKIC